MNATSSRLRLLHFVTLGALVGLEYLQTVMASFSSSYIMGGIDAAPEEFSLAAAVYAGVAVVMIFKHRVLVQTLGYRRFIQLSLLAFAVGALITGLAHDVQAYVFGRAVQALGGSAFFTGARVQVNHYRGTERMTAIRLFATGIFLGSGVAPFMAGHLVDAWGWRAVFLIMVPLAVVVAGMVHLSMPAHEPVEHENPGQVHSGGTLVLVAGVFLLQFMFERVPYDVFSSGTTLWGIAAVAAAALAWFMWHDWSRDDGLIPYRHFVDSRFLAGLSVYFFCYVIGAIGSYMTPVLLVRGLGFNVTSSGWLLSAVSLIGLVTVFIHFECIQRFAKLKVYLLFALAALFAHGWWMSSLDTDVTQASLFWPLLLSNGLFLAVAQGTAALGTFRDVNEQVFSQAYQLKNAMREVANATGVSIATIVLQMRSTLHYQRLVESTSSLGPLYANGAADPMSLTGASPTAEALTRLSALITQQSTFMACLDYYWALCGVAVVAAIVVAWQKKFV